MLNPTLFKMFRLSLIISLVALAFGSTVRNGMMPRAGERIVGGHAIQIEDVPWQVSVRFLGSHRCGGSIFTVNSIITAGQCVYGAHKSELEILAGSTYKSGSDGHTRPVNRILLNRDYKPGTMDFDIAVLIVKAFELSSKIQPIKIPWFHEEIGGGTVATVTGWGKLSEGGILSNELQSVDVTLVSNEACQKAYGLIRNITDNMLCAGAPTGDHDSCEGDVGGPLVVENKLYGIVSWGHGCGRSEYPTTYTRVAAFHYWIDANHV